MRWFSEVSQMRLFVIHMLCFTGARESFEPMAIARAEWTS